MAKQYKIITDDETREDFQLTIEVSEETTITKKTKTSVGQLLEDHKQAQSRIQSEAAKADDMVSELEAIRDNLGIKDIPVPERMQNENQDKIVTPPRGK